MNDDRDSTGARVTHPGAAEPPVGAWVPLPEAPPAGSDRPQQSDGDRYRRARRRSRLTAAALIVGSGASAATLAYHLLPPAAPAAGGAAGAASSTAGVGTTKVTQTGKGPVVTHTIATTSASGVTTYKTVQVVNGKTVVTHVHKATSATFHDN